jgi:hypothetical protein
MCEIRPTKLSININRQPKEQTKTTNFKKNSRKFKIIYNGRRINLINSFKSTKEVARKDSQSRQLKQIES